MENRKQGKAVIIGIPKEDQEVERRLALTPKPFRYWSHWVTALSFKRAQVIPFTTPTITMPSQVPRSWNLLERCSKLI